MSSTNLCVLGGRLGRDPEMNYTPNGTAVTKFSLAVDGYNSAEKARTTMWVNVVCFNKLAETLATWGQKGARLDVVGKLSIREYTDKQANKKTWVEIVADSIEIVTGMRSKEQVNGTAVAVGAQSPDLPDMPGDERPF